VNPIVPKRCLTYGNFLAVPIGQDVPVPRSTGMCESGQVIDARRSAGVWLAPDADFFLPPIAGVSSAALSAMRRAPQLGQKPRRFQMSKIT